jgi:phage terminase large subunit-like protein
MWIGGSEGAGYRYEVISLVDGYLVQMRDLDTGSLEDREARLFRTARVAFAHAEAMAAIDRFAASVVEQAEAPAERHEAARCEAVFAALRVQHDDEGCIYAPQSEPAPLKRILH